ncbi:sulfite reductase subunit beta [Acidihalobacter yilgarnensis]|uniref:assimilatory sulfite reductase (NADPH) n=2 Tax=Acidihalobacter yilgarnensis TaxID=2819280 RepID=A0A1D8IMY0_9GAMM|nr:sulfite reductase subunit beta [Acidihalobacter yilgarnensis]
MSIKKPLSDVERIKAASRGLRGSLVESLALSYTGAIKADDTQVIKFHGIYQQDDRDVRAERQRQKLEPLYQFMARLRLPGGVLNATQWLALSAIARAHGNASLRITSRQSIQFHGLFKGDIKPALQDLKHALLDTISACGDINRNVIACANPNRSHLHGEVYSWAQKIAVHLLPKSRAYHEIWLDGEPVVKSEEEPLYGGTYLPRKFKIALAIPPSNDVDVFAHDLGFIAIEEDGRLAGFNVTIGGGLGRSHANPATYARVADVIGFCTPDQVLAVTEAVVTAQRDHGNRSDRAQARLKYTIDRMGLAPFVAEVARRSGFDLAPTRPACFDTSGDEFGWVEHIDGTASLTMYVPGGRVIDGQPGLLPMSGLDELVRAHGGELRLTCNQNLVLVGVTSAMRPEVDAVLERFELDLAPRRTPLETGAMACVALPTCPLAMAESERYLPVLLTRLNALLGECGLEREALSLRMTGCPNGCARPYLAEIGLIGKAPGLYDLYLGSDRAGTRLNTRVRESLDEDGFIDTLRPLLTRFAQERLLGEGFGDFLHRLDLLGATSTLKQGVTS